MVGWKLIFLCKLGFVIGTSLRRCDRKISRFSSFGLIYWRKFSINRQVYVHWYLVDAMCAYVLADQFSRCRKSLTGVVRSRIRWVSGWLVGVRCGGQGDGEVQCSRRLGAQQYLAWACAAYYTWGSGGWQSIGGQDSAIGVLLLRLFQCSVASLHPPQPPSILPYLYLRPSTW